MQVGMTLLQQSYLNHLNQLLDKSSSQTLYRNLEESREYKIGTELMRLNNAEQTRRNLQNYGNKFMNDSHKKLAIVVFAGGLGERSGEELKQFKQFTEVRENMPHTTTLFNQALQSIERHFEKNCKIFLYIICNKINSSKILSEVQQKLKTKYPYIPVYICFQHQFPLLTQNGAQNIYKKNKKDEKLTYPSGIGTFRHAVIEYGYHQKYTLEDHLIKLVEPDLVYCVGCTDFDQRGLILEMIGLAHTQNLDCVFACSQYEGTDKNQMPVVCLTTKPNNKPSWLVMEYSCLRAITDKKQINNFLIWRDNFVFSPRLLKFDNKPSTNYSQVHHQFIKKTLKSKNNPNIILPCIVCEQTISFSLMRNKQKCVGYMIGQGSIYKIPKHLQIIQKKKRGILSSLASKIQQSPKKK